MSFALAPARIPLAPVCAWGVSCLRASQLAIQDSDEKGRIWASRGQWVYCLDRGARDFVRRARIPTGLNAHALRSFRFVRGLTRQPVCVELLPLPGGRVVAMSGGAMWAGDEDGRSFEPTLTLRHFGPGVGSGLLSTGLARLEDGTVLIGEYWRNPTREEIRLYASDDACNSWHVAHAFARGTVRHVHAIQQDPYTARSWILTGDEREECMVATSDDGLRTLEIIGRGGEQPQRWRASQCVFTEEAVYWGADTRLPDYSGVYRFDRTSRELSKVGAVPGAIRYGTRLASGTMVFSTDRVGGPNEIDPFVSLWLTGPDEPLRTLPLGARKVSRRSRASALLRMPRSQDLDRLYVTPLRTDEFDGDLLIFEASDLEAAARPPS